MISNRFFRRWLIYLIPLFFLGCYSPYKEKMEKVEKIANNPALTEIGVSPINETPFSDLETDSIETRESRWSGLSNQEMLDSTAKLLEISISRQKEGEYAIAEYYFQCALEIMYEVNETDPELDIPKYQALMLDIKRCYRAFVSGLEVLPEESSPEAVLLGIELSDDDSINGENGLFYKPEFAIETVALDSALVLDFTFPPVPIVKNKKVRNAIAFFQGKGRKVFRKWLERSEFYVPSLQKILREEGLPEELVYLSMIESGFNPRAYSYAHASGPWQFIRSTGRIFKLKIDWWYDERRDPVKSTLAACKYLKKLYMDFDDWYLALASYNCGEGKILRHIRKYKTRDFWKLRRIPRQTRNYIPTYLAAVIIAQNPTEYGFEDVVHKNTPPYDSVLVTECLDLKLIAEIVDTTYRCIKELNPAVVRWCTPPTQDSIWLKIPQGRADIFYKCIASIPDDQKRSWVRHRVRRGETLSTIARKYGTSMRAITDIEANKIRNRHRIREGQYLLIPVPPHKYSRSLANYRLEPEEPYIPPEGREKVIYIVRRGDNLSTIAERYRTSVNALKRWNNLRGKRYIYPGQKLVIWLKEDFDYAISNDNSGIQVATNGKIHLVKRGENLSWIAQKHGLSVDTLMVLNGLSGRSVIHPGDEIKLYDGGEAPLKPAEIEQSIYTVKRGDTLWDIAQAHGIDLSELIKYNNISGRGLIKPGDKLKIPSQN